MTWPLISGGVAVAVVTTNTVRIFWTAGDLRCVLVSNPSGPQKHMVQVVKGTEVVCSAYIDEPIAVEAPAAADRLKIIFVERAP